RRPRRRDRSGRGVGTAAAEERQQGARVRMTATLFELTFLLIAPFWLLMIFAPKWSWTRKIAESYLIVLPPVVIYVVLMIPVLPELIPLVTRPELGPLTQFMSTE